MNDYIIDTNVVIWYFTETKLSSAVAQKAIVAGTEYGTIYLASITIVELIYLVEKKKLPAEVLVVLRTALDEPSSPIRLLDLNREIADSAAKIPRAIVPDMPDRIIASTSLYVNLPLITSDSNIRKLKNIRTIW